MITNTTTVTAPTKTRFLTVTSACPSEALPTRSRGAEFGWQHVTSAGITHVMGDVQPDALGKGGALGDDRAYGNPSVDGFDTTGGSTSLRAPI